MPPSSTFLYLSIVEASSTSWIICVTSARSVEMIAGVIRSFVFPLSACADSLASILSNSSEFIVLSFILKPLFSFIHKLPEYISCKRIDYILFLDQPFLQSCHTIVHELKMTRVVGIRIYSEFQPGMPDDI